MLRDEVAAFYRLSLTFQGDEADTIKSALGKTQAEGLLKVCRFYLEHAPEDENA